VVGLDVSGKEWDVWNGRGGWISRRECGEIVPAGLTDGSIVFRSVDRRSFSSMSIVQRMCFWWLYEGYHQGRE